MPTYSTSNIHLDVLMGRDESLDCADFMMPSMYLILDSVLHLIEAFYRLRTSTTLEYPCRDGEEASYVNCYAFCILTICLAPGFMHPEPNITIQLKISQIRRQMFLIITCSPQNVITHYYSYGLSIW